MDEEEVVTQKKTGMTDGEIVAIFFGCLVAVLLLIMAVMGACLRVLTERDKRNKARAIAEVPFRYSSRPQPPSRHPSTSLGGATPKHFAPLMNSTARSSILGQAGSTIPPCHSFSLSSIRERSEEEEDMYATVESDPSVLHLGLQRHLRLEWSSVGGGERELTFICGCEAFGFLFFICGCEAFGLLFIILPGLLTIYVCHFCLKAFASCLNRAAFSISLLMHMCVIIYLCLL